MQDGKEDVGTVQHCIGNCCHGLFQFSEGSEIQPSSLCHSDSLGVWPVFDFEADRMTIKSIMNAAPLEKNLGIQ